MPAKSKSQQRLFGMALAVRRGEMKRKDVWDEVLDIVDSDMTDKEIEDFAATKHKGLKEYFSEIPSMYEYLTERGLGDGWKKWKEDGCEINMLAFEEPSQYGIESGKISKLWIRKNGKVLCNYDRGWDVEPDDEVKSLFDKIVKKYN